MKNRTLACFQFSTFGQLVSIPQALTIYHLVEVAQERCKGAHFCQVAITLEVGNVALWVGKEYRPASSWKQQCTSPSWHQRHSIRMPLEQFLQTIRDLFPGVSFHDLFLIIYDEFYRVVVRDDLYTMDDGWRK